MTRSRREGGVARPAHHPIPGPIRTPTKRAVGGVGPTGVRRPVNRPRPRLRRMTAHVATGRTGQRTGCGRPGVPHTPTPPCGCSTGRPRRAVGRPARVASVRPIRLVGADRALRSAATSSPPRPGRSSPVRPGRSSPGRSGRSSPPRPGPSTPPRPGSNGPGRRGARHGRPRPSGPPAGRPVPFPGRWGRTTARPEEPVPTRRGGRVRAAPVRCPAVPVPAVRLPARCPASRRFRAARVRLVPVRCRVLPGSAARPRCPAPRRSSVVRAPQPRDRRYDRPVVPVRTAWRQRPRPVRPGSAHRFRTVPPRLTPTAAPGADPAPTPPRWARGRAHPTPGHRSRAHPTREHRGPARLIRGRRSRARPIREHCGPARRRRAAPPVRRARSPVPPARKVPPPARSPAPRDPPPPPRTTRVVRGRRAIGPPDHGPLPVPGPPVRVGSSQRRQSPGPPRRAYDRLSGRRTPSAGRHRRCVHPIGRRRPVSRPSRRRGGSTAREWPG